jgi:hypothetical protein
LLFSLHYDNQLKEEEEKVPCTRYLNLVLDSIVYNKILGSEEYPLQEAFLGISGIVMY